MEQETRKASTRFYEIDLLRFLAALSVVIYHYTFRAYGVGNLSPVPYVEIGRFTRYGYLGVELFFIISGYVILLSVQGKTVRQFFISRVQRLYPAFWVACTLTFLVVRIWGHGTTDAFSAPILSAGVSQYIHNMTMLHNFFGVSGIDMAYWTLTIEITFYFIVSLLVAYNLMPHLNLIIGVWLIYAGVAPYLYGPTEPFTYLFFPRYAPYFIAGMLFHLLQNPAGRTWVRYGLLLVAYLLAVRTGWDEAISKGAYLKATIRGDVVVTIITASFLVFGLIAFRKISLGSYSWLAKLGALTYPLYLLHSHIGYVVFHQLGHLFNKYVLLGGLLAVMLLASYLISIWVEKPFSRLLGQQVDRSLTYLSTLTKNSPA